MTTMIREVYEAFREAGATEEKAAPRRRRPRRRLRPSRPCAKEDRLRRIEERLTRIEERIGLLQWMVGFLLALGVANLWLLIRLAARGPGG